LEVLVELAFRNTSKYKDESGGNNDAVFGNGFDRISPDK
jgi:hypothetical protein